MSDVLVSQTVKSVGEEDSSISISKRKPTRRERRRDFESWMTKHRIRSTIMMGTGIWMSIHSYLWATEFAVSSIRPGVEIAAIIAAVQGIATFYTAWVFKIYCENKIP